MSGRPGAPTRGRIVSLLWFPFFFAAASSAAFVLSFADPAPHRIPIAIVDSPAATADMSRSLQQSHPAGFSIREVDDAVTAADLVRRGEVAAAFVRARDAPAEVLIASAASSTRADFLVLAIADASSTDPRTVDLVPLADGDGSGIGLFAYGLPLHLIGLVTTIALLQLGPWPIRRKAAAIAAAGASASAGGLAIGVLAGAVPPDPWLLPTGFLLTQIIGWTTTAAALALRQFAVPASMTFVLLLGIPSSGATVNGDMLPAPMRALNDVLPFAQFIDAARATAYFDGRGAARPLALLLVWAAAAAAAMWLASRRSATTATTHAASRRLPPPEGDVPPSGVARGRAEVLRVEL